MNCKFGTRLRLLPILIACLISGCAVAPPEERAPAIVEVSAALSALAYYQSLQQMPAAEMSRERSTLAASAGVPGNQLRLAMLLGHPRGAQDLNRALALLSSLLKSQDPVAQSLHGVARLLADNYNERLKLDVQAEKQGALLKEQLKESQRKTVELQEKLNGLADIERTLLPRARTRRPATAAEVK